MVRALTAFVTFIPGVLAVFDMGTRIRDGVHFATIGRRQRSHEEWAASRKARPARIVDGRRMDGGPVRHLEETPLGEDEAPVGTGFGTYFAYLWIGTPPQRSVISYLTVVMSHWLI